VRCCACSARALTMISASSLGTCAWRVRPPPLVSSWPTSSPGSNGILDHYAAIRSQPSICRPHRTHTLLQPHRVPGRTLVANACLAGPCCSRSSGTCAPVADPARRTSFPAHVCPLDLANCSALRSPNLQIPSQPAFQPALNEPHLPADAPAIISPLQDGALYPLGCFSTTEYAPALRCYSRPKTDIKV